MWYKEKVEMAQLNENNRGLSSHLGIVFTRLDDEALYASMPVDERTIQPFGLLHGGATAALAETVGSVASLVAIGMGDKVPVGMEVTAQHIRSVTKGQVHAKCIPVNLGRTVHIWDLRVTDDDNRLIAVCKLTTMIIDKK